MPASNPGPNPEFKRRRMMKAFQQQDIETTLELAGCDTERAEIVLAFLIMETMHRLGRAIAKRRVVRLISDLYGNGQLELRFRFCVGDAGTMPDAVLASIPIRTPETQLVAEFLTVVHTAIQTIDRLNLHRLAGEIATVTPNNKTADRWAAMLLSGITARLAMLTDASIFLMDYPPASRIVTFSPLTFDDYANGQHPGLDNRNPLQPGK